MLSGWADAPAGGAAASAAADSSASSAAENGENGAHGTAPAAAASAAPLTPLFVVSATTGRGLPLLKQGMWRMRARDWAVARAEPAKKLVCFHI